MEPRALCVLRGESASIKRVLRSSELKRTLPLKHTLSRIDYRPRIPQIVPVRSDCSESSNQILRVLHDALRQFILCKSVHSRTKLGKGQLKIDLNRNEFEIFLVTGLKNFDYGAK